MKYYVKVTKQYFFCGTVYFVVQGGWVSCIVSL